MLLASFGLDPDAPGLDKPSGGIGTHSFFIDLTTALENGAELVVELIFTARLRVAENMNVPATPPSCTKIYPYLRRHANDAL